MFKEIVPYIVGCLIWSLIFLGVVKGVRYIDSLDWDTKPRVNEYSYEEVSKNCTWTGLVVVHNERYIPESDYYVCVNKWAYCRKECKNTFDDLNDTWWSNTANQTDLANWINQCIDTCLKTN